MLEQKVEGDIPRVPGFNNGYRSKSGSSPVLTLSLHSCLRYLGPSSDPMFPSDYEYHDGGWTDSSEYPHVMGCIESREICDTAKRCYKLREYRPKFGEAWEIPFSSPVQPTSAQPVLDFLASSLDPIFSLPFSRSFTLLADKMHSNGFATQLDDDHWKAGARRVFELGLAGVQVDIFNKARGKGSKQPGYRLEEPRPESAACSSVKIPTMGWKNINLTELTCVAVSLSSLWMATIKHEERILLVWLFNAVNRPFTRWFR